jgi:hypothetical protein
MKSGIINPIGDGLQGNAGMRSGIKSGMKWDSQIPVTCHATAPKARLGVEIACFGLSRQTAGLSRWAQDVP